MLVVMSAELDQAATQPGAPAESTTRPSSAHALWQILTHFDPTKLFAPRALRNAIGVVLPLVAGFALHMPRAGLVAASGALNVSYSDGSDSYGGRSRRMLASSVICAIAVFAGAISGQHQFVAIVLATAWAFIAGMSYALGGATPDLGAISLVTLLIYAAQTLTSRQAAASGALALAGGLLQTALSIALWPVRRYEPERRVLAKFYRELANRAAAPLNPTSSRLASIHSEQVQNELSGLGRDPGADSLRYRGLLDQGERIRLTFMMLLRLRLRMQRESQTYPAIDVISGYLEQTSQILRRIGESLSASALQPLGEMELQNLHRLAQFSGLLREQGPAAMPSFLAAVTRDALFQMDALSGQLRAALDLSRNGATVDKSLILKHRFGSLLGWKTPGQDRNIPRKSEPAIAHLPPCASPRCSGSAWGPCGPQCFVAPHLLAAHDYRAGVETGIRHHIHARAAAHRRNNHWIAARHRPFPPFSPPCRIGSDLGFCFCISAALAGPRELRYFLRSCQRLDCSAVGH